MLKKPTAISPTDKNAAKESETTLHSWLFPPRSLRHNVKLAPTCAAQPVFTALFTGRKRLGKGRGISVDQ